LKEILLPKQPVKSKEVKEIAKVLPTEALPAKEKFGNWIRSRFLLLRATDECFTSFLKAWSLKRSPSTLTSQSMLLGMKFPFTKTILSSSLRRV
jgi:hypothetical protein